MTLGSLHITRVPGSWLMTRIRTWRRTVVREPGRRQRQKQHLRIPALSESCNLRLRGRRAWEIHSPYSSFHRAGKWGSGKRTDLLKVTWLPGRTRSKPKFHDRWHKALPTALKRRQRNCWGRQLEHSQHNCGYYHTNRRNALSSKGQEKLQLTFNITGPTSKALQLDSNNGRWNC